MPAIDEETSFPFFPEQSYPLTYFPDQYRHAQGFNDPISGALADVGSLRSFLSFADFELHLITFLKTLVTFRGDGAVVNKNVGTIRTSDEPVALGIVEPLDRAFHLSRPPVSARPKWGKPKDVPAIRCILERLGWCVKTKWRGCRGPRLC